MASREPVSSKKARARSSHAAGPLITSPTFSEGELVLGIDPGLNTTGYGVLRSAADGPKLVEAGVIRGGSGRELSSRVRSIYSSLGELLGQYDLSAIALEELFSHYARPRTAILMGHARGVICLAAAQADVPLVHYSATHVKKMLTGSGHASKAQMQRAIQQQFGLRAAPDPPDVADALAIALCHFYAQPQLA